MLTMFMSSCKNGRNHSGHNMEMAKEVYTCTMHPEVVSVKPGKCPKCGMTLIKKATETDSPQSVKLESLLKPTNEFVISTIPLTTVSQQSEAIEIDALGNIGYDTREVGSISARVTGRIEKLYVRYRYQKVTKGQKILDIYSPELMTAQQNLLFLLQNDAGNLPFIQAAKEKLLLLGMSNEQLLQVIKSGKPSLTISVFSNYSGHIHETGSGNNMNAGSSNMKDISLITEELPLKEGMYLQKGQSIFSVYNPVKAWAILNIYAENQTLVKLGNPVEIIPETVPGKVINGKIDFIEPFYRKENKTLTVRVYFNNAVLKIPIGSQVKAVISGNAKNASWLPAESVLSLGMEKIVFLKSDGGFRAKRINTGITYRGKIQIIDGLAIQDSIAVNAQYLMDSESFIKINR